MRWAFVDCKYRKGWLCAWTYSIVPQFRLSLLTTKKPPERDIAFGSPAGVSTSAVGSVVGNGGFTLFAMIVGERTPIQSLSAPFFLSFFEWRLAHAHQFPGAWIACWQERQTRDRKVASSNSSRSCRRIFFSRVNFVC